MQDIASPIGWCPPDAHLDRHVSIYLRVNTLNLAFTLPKSFYKSRLINLLKRNIHLAESLTLK